MLIRPAVAADRPAIWSILRPVIRAGETYPLPRDMTEESAIAYWTAPTHEVFVALDGSEILGTYYIRPNQQAGGAHVANCGYMTAQSATGRGIATAMATHSVAHARGVGYLAIQFNFVIATNTRAVALWTRLGFSTLCRLPEAYHHPAQGYVDALVMFQAI
jgi:RimJ/RimL family protein N-acetyltransferase